MAESAAVLNKPFNRANYEELMGEYKAGQQHLQSKEQALRILQGQLKKADLFSLRLKQEMKQLRSQLSRTQIFSPDPSALETMRTSPKLIHNSGDISVSISKDLIMDKEVLIQELEKSQSRIGELERLLEQMEDEKEELTDKMNNSESKCAELVKCLEEERKKHSPSQSSVQRVVQENRELQLALVKVDTEKEHFRSRVEHYKNAIERKKLLEAAGEQVMNSPDKKQDARQNAKRIAELEMLVYNLSQSVKVKSTIITHKKKANKVLATKLAELEHQVTTKDLSCMLTSWEDGARESEDGRSFNKKLVRDDSSGSTELGADSSDRNLMTCDASSS